MRHILIPYDDSESSRHALAYALDPKLVPAEAMLHLINVQLWPPAYSEYVTPMYIADIHESLTQCGHAVLAPAVERIKAAGRENSADVRLGNISEQIVERARELGCEQIVMGRRGLSAIKGLFLGSIATRVLHLTDLPVTLIH